MEIYDKRKQGYIEVWLTKAEQQADRTQITDMLLSNAETKKCKVVYFLSGRDDLVHCMKNLLVKNTGCV